MALGEDVYHGAATFGRIQAVIGMIIGLLVFAVCMFFGVQALRHKSTYTARVTAVVASEPKCLESKIVTKNEQKSVFDCGTVTFAYEVDGAKYSTSMDSNRGIKYAKGDPVSLYYDPKNPKDARMYPDDYRAAGWILVVFGSLVLLFTGIWFFVTRQSEFAAAAGGAAGGVRLLADALR